MKIEYSKWLFGIEQFRDYVNSYADILILLSKETKKMNYWNCVCSAMDWIDVAIEHLEVSTIDQDDWHKYSLQIYTFISSIDIVWQSIIKMHKMLINKNTVPFSKNSTIFQDERLGLDDNRYFKHLRAAFGAHPVDLVERDKENGTTTLKYASWPTNGIYHQYDYAVVLYSDKDELETIPFGFKVNQLIEFFEIRYKYLEDIEIAIKAMCDAYYKKMKTISINKVDEPIEQLMILKKENEDRLNNDYYEDAISRLISYFQIEFSCPENEKYIERFNMKMNNGIQELYDNISAMEVCDLEVKSFLDPKYDIRNFGYAFSKLSSAALCSTHITFVFAREVIEFLQDLLVFEYNTIQELYWLTIIALNIRNGNI